jgi:hypothetical protein
MEFWAGCIAGALEETTYRHLLADAGFGDIGVEVTRAYHAEDVASSERCDSLASAERAHPHPRSPAVNGNKWVCASDGQCFRDHSALIIRQNACVITRSIATATLGK